MQYLRSTLLPRLFFRRGGHSEGKGCQNRKKRTRVLNHLLPINPDFSYPVLDHDAQNLLCRSPLLQSPIGRAKDEMSAAADSSIRDRADVIAPVVEQQVRDRRQIETTTTEAQMVSKDRVKNVSNGLDY